MTLDEYGALWLSDPWIAAVAIVGILATVLWSHGWIATGSAPRTRRMAIRMRRDSANGIARLQSAVRAARPASVPDRRRRAAASVVHLDRQRRPRTAA